MIILFTARADIQNRSHCQPCQPNSPAYFNVVHFHTTTITKVLCHLTLRKIKISSTDFNAFAPPPSASRGLRSPLIAQNERIRRGASPEEAAGRARVFRRGVIGFPFCDHRRRIRLLGVPPWRFALGWRSQGMPGPLSMLARLY
jgi:hypothetical protein